jgi:cytochrome P450
MVVADRTIAKEVLMDRPKTFCRFRSQLTPAKVLGLNGLLFAEGDSWSRQRRLTVPPFSHKNVELMSPLIAKEIDEFILRL